jgi:SAM-dependent methyltransferase
MNPDAAFDEYVQNYDEALERGLSVSGESKLSFAERRLRWLAKSLAEMGERPSLVLDFGCGIGDSAALFPQILGVREFVGVDTSQKSIQYANTKFSSAGLRFATPDSPIAEYGTFDLAHCNGVFHHIPPIDRQRAARYVHDSLRPGGVFAFWENNPWNPGTRYVMSRIPFDHDAETLSVTDASQLLESVGFRILQRRFLFVFPRVLKYLRFLEPQMSALPIGAQYQILCRRV